jgi:hypothetical protein
MTDEAKKLLRECHAEMLAIERAHVVSEHFEHLIAEIERLISRPEPAAPGPVAWIQSNHLRAIGGSVVNGYKEAQMCRLASFQYHPDFVPLYDRPQAPSEALDAARWRWMRENVTYRDLTPEGMNRAVIRRWYHDSIRTYAMTLDEVADAAIDQAREGK